MILGSIDPTKYYQEVLQSEIESYFHTPAYIILLPVVLNGNMALASPPEVPDGPRVD